MTKVTLYEVGGSIDGNQHWHFTATKREAEAYLKEKAEELEVDPVDYFCLKITTRTYEPNKRGIVQALNDLVAETCLNEG